jgi:transcriptional regulator with PAS, ATPase and Fis domain
MSRLSPRVTKYLPAQLQPRGNGYYFQTHLIDIGPDGANLKSKKNLPLEAITPGTSHSVKVFLYGFGDMMIDAAVVRGNPESVALNFSGIPRGDRQKIWEFIRDDLVRMETCPYCGFPQKKQASWICKKCGWNLNFAKHDYIQYWEKERLRRQIDSCLNDLPFDELNRISRYLHEEILGSRHQQEVEGIEEFVGTCAQMKHVFSLIRKVAPTDLPVLLLGESGTGKDLTARAIHEKSVRKENPFLAINCAAIPDSLIEAELFGYEKGAFTGAYRAKKGKFEHVDQGTIFLDEIGELPLSLQPKLLRFLESQMIERIGSLESRRVDVRIIAATNKELEREVESGNFRSDLYHRIKVFTINLPSLRERGKDKTILARYILKQIQGEQDWGCQGFTPEALEAIHAHHWPGNVREMINRIRRAVVVQDKWIQPEDLELTRGLTVEKGTRLKDSEANARKEMIRASLADYGYNISQTARSLGISRPYLYELIKKLEIPIERH